MAESEIIPETPKPKRRRRVTASNVQQFAKQALFDRTSEILEDFVEQLHNGVKNREKTYMELAARMYYGDRGSGGVNIIHNTLNVNGQVGNQQPYRPRGPEAIIRNLEERDRAVVEAKPGQSNALALVPARLNQDVAASEIIDAEQIE